MTTLEIIFPGLEYLEVDFEKERIATGMMEGLKNFQSEKFRKLQLFHSSEGRLRFEKPGISWGGGGGNNLKNQPKPELPKIQTLNWVQIC